MTTNEEIREFAKTLEVDDPAMELPREDYYQVMAARPRSATESVTPPIRGRYHAMYACDQIEDEMGYAGVTFHLQEVSGLDKEIDTES